MTNTELIQENKWMREKLSSLCVELMALSVDTETILISSVRDAPKDIATIAARLYDMSQHLSKEGFDFSKDGFE